MGKLFDARKRALDDIEAGKVSRKIRELESTVIERSAEIERLLRHIADVGEAMKTKALNNPNGVKASTLELLGDELLAALPSNDKGQRTERSAAK